MARQEGGYEFSNQPLIIQPFKIRDEAQIGIAGPYASQGIDLNEARLAGSVQPHIRPAAIAAA